MGTIADKLQAARNSKAAIKAALESKGKTPGDKFSDYAPLILSLDDLPQKNTSVINNLSEAVTVWSYDTTTGYTSTSISAGSTSELSRYAGLLVLNIPVSASLTTSGATVDITNKSIAAGVYALGFTENLTVTIAG